MRRTRPELGEIELDLGRYELRRQGRRVKLEKKPMEMLIFLVGRREQLVSRKNWLDCWIGTCPVTAFYKGESQGKNFPGDWKEQRFLPGSPAHVMLGGSWGALFPQIHVAVVTTASVSDATSSTVAIKMPTMVLSEARGL